MRFNLEGDITEYLQHIFHFDSKLTLFIHQIILNHVKLGRTVKGTLIQI